MAQLLSAPFLVTMIVAFGIPQALTYFVARREILTTLSSVRRILLVSLGAGVLGSGLCVLLGLAIDFPSIEYWILFCIVCASLPIANLVSSYRGAAQGLQMFDVVNLERWVAVVGRLALLIAMAATGTLDVFSAVAATWGSGLLAGLVYVRVIPTMRAQLSSGAIETEVRPVRATVRFGTAVWLGSVSSLLIVRVDQLILAIMVAPISLGLYAVAVSIAEIPQAIAGGLQQLLLGKIAGNRNANQVGLACRLGLLFATVMGVAGIALAPFVVAPVFGPDFAAAVPTTQILLVATIPLSVATLLTGGLVGLGLPAEVSRVQAIAALVSVAVLIPLVLWIGVTGAAVAGLIGYASLLALLLRVAKVKAGISAGDVLNFRRGDLAVLRSGGRG